MFYSHEILTSRKYGVATVWLVATLGAKSSTKKVTRKAILNVDLRKACETIMEPEAPMALRLQSNLLYGVSRVYNQQWDYLLTDAQAAQNTIRALMKTARSDGLDPLAGKANPEQLILMEDPDFDIDQPLLPLDLDITIAQDNSQRSSQSMLSIRGRSGSVLSSQAASIIGINLPSSSHGGNPYQLPLNDPFGNSSAQKPFGGHYNIDDEALILDDDELFDFGEDGNLRDIPASEREARRAGSLHPQHRLGSDSAASGRVRKELNDARMGNALPLVDGDEDFDMLNFNYGDDDMQMFPDAEPFPVMTGGLGGNDRPLRHSDEDRVHSDPEGNEEPSSVSAEAPARKKRAKKIKKLILDRYLELTNNVMAASTREYVDRMTGETSILANKKAAAQAKKNAFISVYGTGLNGVGEGIGIDKFASPLDMFAGDALLQALTHQLPASKSKKGKKRARSPSPSEAAEENTPTKRSRDADSPELPRNNEGDNLPLIFNDDDGAPPPASDTQSNSIELGRDAPSALADYPSSAMPWNISASLPSHRPSSLPPNRPLTSASPLIGRGSVLPDNFDGYDQLMDEDMVQYGREDTQSIGFGTQGKGVSSSQVGGFDAGEEYQIFGPAANVDTQTAGESQWVRSILDRESENFFEFLKGSISAVEAENDGFDGDDEEKSIGFEQLFQPEKNSSVVAAQAFYHVLCLATRDRVWVEQKGEDMEPWGEIRIGVKA